VRPGGEVVWLGKVNVDEEVAFRWGTLMGEKAHRPLELWRRRAAARFPWIAREYLEGRVKLDPLITRRIELHEINDGFPPSRAARASAPWSSLAEAALGDLALESGESILDYRQSYVTHGELEPDGRNAVLICASLTGNHHRSISSSARARRSIPRAGTSSRRTRSATACPHRPRRACDNRACASRDSRSATWCTHRIACCGSASACASCTRSWARRWVECRRCNGQ
jgi:hypothetical protein